MVPIKGNPTPRPLLRSNSVALHGVSYMYIYIIYIIHICINNICMIDKFMYNARSSVYIYGLPIVYKTLGKGRGIFDDHIVRELCFERRRSLNLWTQVVITDDVSLKVFMEHLIRL